MMQIQWNMYKMLSTQKKIITIIKNCNNKKCTCNARTSAKKEGRTF